MKQYLLKLTDGTSVLIEAHNHDTQGAWLVFIRSRSPSDVEVVATYSAANVIGFQLLQSKSAMTLDNPTFQSALDKAFGFIGFEAPPQIPTPSHQSLKARFPGISLAATDLGVSRVHLYRVLTGERKSAPLKARWNAWLKARPSFSSLQH